MGPVDGPRTEDNETERNVSMVFLYGPTIQARSAHESRRALLDLDLIISGIPLRQIGSIERHLAYLKSMPGVQNNEELEG
jgi:hypothetical protein